MSSEQAAAIPEHFEDALQELESLVENLERGELSLEESLRQFERGIQLARQCQQSLAQAEQRVQVLMEQAGEQQLQDIAAE